MRNQRGSVLIMAVWMTSWIGLLLTELYAGARTDLLLLKRQFRNIRAQADLQSAVTLMKAAIFSDPDEGTDSTTDIWYGRLTLPHPWQDRLVIEVFDEDGKINLNQVSREWLTAFFEVYEEENGPLETDHKKLTDEILIGRTEDKFRSDEDLLLLEGIAPADYSVLKRFWTVYSGRNQVNFNTAPLIVLKSLIRSQYGDHFVKERLIQAVQKYREQAGQERDLPVTYADLSPRALTERLGLTDTPRMQHLIQRILPMLTADSRTFAVKFRTAAGVTAEGIYEQAASWRELRNVYWHVRYEGREKDYEA